MAVKRDEKQNTNVMDIFFNGWSNQFEYIEEIEQKSLEAIKNQNEWIQGTRNQLCQMEENSKKLTSEWKENAQKLLTDNKLAFNGVNLTELVEKMEEIGHRSQTIAFLPGKASLDLLSTTGEQIEKNYTKAIGQQQKTRDEISKAYEGVFEQMKQTQLGIFKLFEFNPSLSK
ncbi:hypothetical protein [Bacillus sp. B15-48]|uniref:hypothetical protein n=1 Tax=Bacillus sp. B15-48 TaxID=1548601 RepID=UPI00193FBB30|nr:hypothetical protein [Bacillus sp. B15-48]MBM4762769.1 hypothetical protein [Bacillus sp. B15-48]